MTLTALELVGVLLFGLLIVLITALLFHLRRTTSSFSPPSSDETPVSPTARRATATRAAPRRRRGGLARMAAAATAAEEGDRDEAEVRGAGEGGRVKKKKEANREARREAREARLAQLEEMREREQRREEQRQEEQEEQERLEREREEEGRKRREEKEKKEMEEYAEWKGTIEVEEEGEDGDMAVEEEGMMERFCEYVKEGKIVVLEEMAAEFGLKTEQVVDRLVRLEESGGISGVFDDRGKFIYVSRQEMEAVAEFIRSKGRVSIHDLARESTRLLHLDRLGEVGGA
eukprot:GFKZ01013242.1.p1 GENE.GFKZ01013242.1~~GFKZ01013242.1.p1  ORF type:complete len:329 (-),score=87.21 GFKZ01013242.1:1311-2174(-)